METSEPRAATKPPQLYGKGHSGNRAGRMNVRARAAELFDELRGDFGELTRTDQVLLRQATMMIARSEALSGVKHADAAIRLSSEGRRLLMSLRRHAPKRDSSEVSLASYLHSRKGAAVADAGAEVAVDEERTGDLANRRMRVRLFEWP
jgi:hypothetical protein